MFIFYKEVFDVYNVGLEVFEDIVLMWCDDNYGYIKYFLMEVECVCKGGNGIYYYVLYWGCLYDYFWLGIFSLYLFY